MKIVGLRWKKTKILVGNNNEEYEWIDGPPILQMLVAADWSEKWHDVPTVEADEADE